MELPGHGVIEGEWDLRGRVDEYVGKVNSPANAFWKSVPPAALTFEMEKRGAEVVSVEVTMEHGWDFVPYPVRDWKKYSVRVKS